jgi:hypothetical protein
MSDHEILPESVSIPTDDDDAPELACEVCGTPLVYAGRGRKPRYCEDHRNRSGTNTGPRIVTAGGASRASGKDARLRQDLTTMLGSVGMALMLVESYDGLVVMDRTPATVDALMEVAAQNPKFRKTLEQMVTVSVWSQVSLAVAGIALPIAAHHGIIPVSQDAMAAQFLSETTRARLSQIPPRAPRTRKRAAPEPESDEYGAEVPRDAFGRPL